MIFVVTGCEGFIGKNFVDYILKDENNYVYGIDKLTYASKQNFVHRKNNKNFMFVKEDIKDIKEIPDCDYIINFAAESHVDNSIMSADSFLDSNVAGVKNLLQLARTKYKPPVFVQISTDEVYGSTKDESATELTILNPGNPYSASKAAADMLVLAWSKTHNIPYFIIRPSNNYGFMQYPEKLIPSIIKNYFIGRKILLHNSGLPVRTWLNVQDTVRAIDTIIKKSSLNQIYNISSPDIFENLYVVSRIFSLLCNKFENNFQTVQDFLDYNYNRPGQDIRYNVDDSKLKNLGWQNEFLFDSQINKVVDAYLSYYDVNGVIF